MNYIIAPPSASGNVLPFPIYSNNSQTPVVATAELLRKNPCAAYFALSVLPCSTATLASEFIKGTLVDSACNRAIVRKFLATCSVYDPAGLSKAKRDISLVKMRPADRIRIAEGILASMKEMLVSVRSGECAE